MLRLFADAVPGDVAAAQRHQLAGPQPRADAEHHQSQRRGAFRRVALRGGEGCQLRPLTPRVRRGALASGNGAGRCPGGPCLASASRYSADRYVPRVAGARPARPATQNASITS